MAGKCARRIHTTLLLGTRCSLHSYPATKAAATQFTGNRSQYARPGARLNSILPGMTNTSMVHVPEVIAAAQEQAAARARAEEEARRADGLRARLVRGRDQRFESPFLRRRVRSHQCPAVQLAKNAEREAARRFHKSDPFSRIDLILRRQPLSQL